MYHNIPEKKMTPTDVQRLLDSLFANVKSYRKTENYGKMLNFCKKFKTLAPYNAMLVFFQRPHSNYVLTAAEWRMRFGRGIKEEATPMVILQPFGPINFVFELGDTYPLDDSCQSDEGIIKEIEEYCKAKGKLEPKIYNNLVKNLAVHSIAFNPEMICGSGLYAQILLSIKKSHEITIRINKEKSIRWSADYFITINKNSEEIDRFVSLLHELGHFFCQHLPAPKHWIKKWVTRDINYGSKEFEAESVAWLICERLGINNPSEKYLSDYLKDNKEIPEDVSVDYIFRAFNKIWEILSDNNLNFRHGFLYNYDPEFQKAVNKIIG